MSSSTGAPGFRQLLELDGLGVEFELGNQDVPESTAFTPASVIPVGRHAVDADIARLSEAIQSADRRIDLSTHRSDRLDYSIAVASGVLAGIVDSVWVGELSLAAGREWGAQQVNDIVMNTARKHGYRGDDLSGAILKLEKTFPFAGDKATYDFGGGTIHHLRDLTHHPSPIGLVASIVMQFTGQAWGVTDGQLSGVDVASSGLIGTTVSEKLLFGTIQWVLHLVSDVAGSSATAGTGTGLPGPLLSMLHEAGAALGRLGGEAQQGGFLKRVEGVFRGDATGVPFDFRTELGLLSEGGRQALPVLLNEALVRGFFFVRRAVMAIQAAEPKTLRQLLAVDLRPALPRGNRTITRMLTIATSTFTAVDLLDAAVRAAIASGGESPSATDYVLRVNFVGVAHTSVAIGVDLRLGLERSTDRSDRIALMNEQLHLLNARTFYRVSGVWTAAGEAKTAVHATDEAIAAAALGFQSIWSGTRGDSVEIAQDINRIRAKNPGLLASLQDDLDWSVE